jgi:molecular chaperone IbpA
MKNNLSIFNNLRPLTVGFDNMFDHFEHMLDDSFFSNGTAGNFPPYNIVKTGDLTYNIELALAGFNKKDIEVVSANGQLTVRSKKEETDHTDNTDLKIYQGISKRQFVRSFTVADNVEVRGAELKDGLLVIALERIIPEEHKEKFIEIK